MTDYGESPATRAHMMEQITDVLDYAGSGAGNITFTGMTRDTLRKLCELHFGSDPDGTLFLSAIDELVEAKQVRYRYPDKDETGGVDVKSLGIRKYKFRLYSLTETARRNGTLATVIAALRDDQQEALGRKYEALIRGNNEAKPQ